MAASALSAPGAAERFIRVPIEFITLGPKKFSGETQAYLILGILLRTSSRPALGKPVAEWTDPMSVNDWAAELQCEGEEKRTVEWAIADGLKRKLIERDDQSPKKKKYRYRTSAALWAAAADYEGAQKSEPDVAEEDPEEQQGEETVNDDRNGLRSIQPGKKVVIPLELPCSKIRYHNEVPFPLDVTSRVQNGIVHLRVCAADAVRNALQSLAEKLTGGEGTVNDDRNGLRSLPGGKIARGEGMVNDDRNGLRSSMPELKGIIEAELKRFGRRDLVPLESSLWRKVLSTLNGTPEPVACKVFAEKLQRAEKRREDIYPGLMVSWAFDACERARNLAAAEAAEPKFPDPDPRDSYLNSLASAILDVEAEDANFPANPDLKRLLRSASPADIEAARSRLPQAASR